MDAASLSKSVLELGVMAALVVWYTWQTGIREAALRKDFAALQQYVQDTLRSRLDDTTQVIAANTQVMNRIEHRLGDPQSETPTYESRARPPKSRPQSSADP